MENMIIDLLVGLFKFLWSILRVLIPIMILIEILKETKFIDKIAKVIRPLTKLLTISDQSGVAMLFGVSFGLTIGAGAVIQSTKDYNLAKRDVFLLTMFISVCHAIFEDSFIYGAVGANVFAMLAARFSSAIIITLIFSKLLKPNHFTDNKEVVSG